MIKANVATNEMPFGVDFSHLIYLLYGIFGTILLLSLSTSIRYFGWGPWSFFAFPIHGSQIIIFSRKKTRDYFHDKCAMVIA